MTPRERDLEAEIQSHLNMAAQDRIHRGETPEHAEVAARREFGNSTLIRETVREVWRRPWLDRLIQDIRFALRTFARTPGVTAIIVLTLALGIGANTAIFSIFDAVLLRALPYRDPGRLVSVLDRQIHDSGRAMFFDLYSDYQNWKANSRLFDGFAAVTWAGSLDKTWTGRGAARTVPALPVTDDYFTVLGVSPVIGRTFDPADLAHGCSVVLSWSFWQSSFAGQRNALGSTMRLDQQDCTIIGVMPASFASYPSPESVFWILMPRPPRPDQFGVFVIGRLKPGVTMQAGLAELSALHRNLHRNDHWGQVMEPGVYGLQEEFTWLAGHNLRITLITLLAAVGAVLLICCVNVANLLLGRSLARRREMAIRAALGSGRRRLLRQLLTESLSLSLAAATLGAGIAIGAVHLFRIANPIELPPATVVEINARVLLFTALLSVVTAVLFGLFPAWRASHTDLIESLKAGGRSSTGGPDRHAFGKGLIAAEMALTVLLLVAAGLLIGSVRNFATAPLGFRTNGIAGVQIQLPNASYPQAAQRDQVWDRIMTTLRRLPQIESIAYSTVVPTLGTGPVSVLEVEGHAAPPADAPLDTGHQSVSPDYFTVMGIPLRSGRLFDAHDRDGSDPVAIINQKAAARYFPGENPVGRHIREFEDRANSKPWFRIVGVVAGEKRTMANEEMSWADLPEVYYAWQQNPPLLAIALIRTHGGALLKAEPIQRMVNAIDRDAVAGSLHSVSDEVARKLAYPRFRAIVLAVFAGLALVLAMVGLYGVLSHLVSCRVNEIGVRMALGATRGQVLRIVVLEGMWPAVVGLVLGLCAALAITRLLSAMLYGLGPKDPATLIIVATALLIAALLAIWLPASRATAVDPMVALRYE